MSVSGSGDQPWTKGLTDSFTGAVRIDALFVADGVARAAGNAVTFEPGARTAWHTRPLRQVLIVTVGAGRVARGRARRGDQAGRRGVVRGRRETLVWCCAHDGDCSHRAAGSD